MFNKKINQRRRHSALVVFSIIVLKVSGQPTDTIKEERFGIHAQTTVITQFKPAFEAKYSGENSLIPQKETNSTITSTLFLGAKLWQDASIFVNPEIAGGSGLSSSYGVAASTNGEAYRVANPAPSFELARIFFKQVISLQLDRETQENDLNKIAGTIPTRYFSFTVGKIGISDYFDKNKYSNDPRTQFLSWALMNNGAWDYPANTKGYSPSIIFEYVTPRQELRYGFSLVSKIANGMAMNWNIKKASSQTLEYTYNYTLSEKKGAVRLLSFFTTTDMGNYNESILINPISPDIHATEAYGHTKYGFGINCEQQINKDLGVFFRTSMNDGNNETWEFTEIDRSVSFGISSYGSYWNRENDNIGLAFVTSSLSSPHRNYLQAGGYGFELGDGNLNYGLEYLTELYYSLELIKHLFISGTYQFIVNPGYNKERGPVNIFSIRVHLVI